ncbi:tripartite tricarboxylate transporter permease [Candidatus Epulonipiscium viviparus]|uniref:tripartite tricarboxylate transporter permease n=1 Tax=Candidatus Epulonipiscium viviparus TaxID=420336 RepID=UPI0027380639|nr:tripartite tricarboxylate transporter permease [Candidatus Epulopiscium viviparus]
MSFMEVLLIFADIMILLQLLLGVIMGIVFGAIPGLNTIMALALALPLTYNMEMIPAIAFLIAVYCGGLSGGSISAILLNIPGTAAVVTTTFDGYPMAKRGESMRALSLAIIASFVGGIISTIILALLTGWLASFALSFGPWEYFGAAILSLALISALIDGDLINGFIATLIGVFLAMIGTDSIGSVTRYTFGSINLAAGIDIIVVIIGIFALSEIISSTNKNLIPKKGGSADFSFAQFIVALKESLLYIPNMIISAVMGVVLGILPGLGGGTASIMAYARAKMASKDKTKFGQGCPEGIIAPETAKNAVSGGALIPAIALGVPGSAPVALIMSAFLVHGVSIGPLVLKEQPHLLNSIVIALIIANIFMFLSQIVLIKYFAMVITVPKYILFPIIAVFCVIGTYVINTTTFNVYIMLGLSVFGMFCAKNKIPLAPMIMGFTLGDIVETYFRKSMIAYNGSFVDAYMGSPVGSVFVTLAIIVPTVVIVKRIIKRSVNE